MKLSRGFTLIEVLVAMAVFAMMAAMAYSTLNQVMLSAEFLNDRMDRLQALQRTMRMLTDDIQQLVPRPVRDELGENFRPALDTGFQTGYAIEMTRGGWSNPITLPRSTLQRVAYRIEDDALVRYQWFTLDRTLSNVPRGITLLDGVEGVEFRFMQDNGEFTNQWPPLNQAGGQGGRLRPRAIEIVLLLENEGELTRLIEVAP